MSENIYLNQIISIAESNKYTKWYCNIIKSALFRASSKKDASILLNSKIEGHHILPKCFKMGGSKDHINIAYLTIKEHFIVHHLLCKMFVDQKKHLMWHAITQFSRNTRPLNSKQISIALSYKHRPCSITRSKSISESRKNTPKINCIYCNKDTDPGNYKRFHGENCKFGPNSSQVKIDRKLKAQQSANTGRLRGTFFDVKTNVESKGKSIHAHNHIVRTCPHCNLTGKGPVMLQKHFTRCKLNNQFTKRASL